MKTITSLIILILMAFSSFSQNPNDALIVLSPGIANIKEIKPKPAKTKGSYYYNTNWSVGTVKFFSGDIIENYPLKYDMRMNQVDIKVDNQVKATSASAVKEIVWINEKGFTEILRNALLFSKDQTGFFSILVDGKRPLLKKTTLRLQEANYNPALDVGSRAKKYVKNESYFTILNGELKKINKSKRKILKCFDNKTGIIKEYVSKNKLNYKNDYDLVKIFEYYNSL